IPTNRSLGIVYDPFVITRERLVSQLKEIEQRMGEIKELPSRHITIPIWYNDSWSQECAKAHGAPNNLEYMAEINHTSVGDVCRDGPVLPRVSDRHTYVPIDEATYWQIRRQYEAGAYEYQIREGSYRLQDYLDKLAVHNRHRVPQAPGSV